MSAKAKSISAAAVVVSAAAAWLFLHDGTPSDASRLRAAASDGFPDLPVPAMGEEHDVAPPVAADVTRTAAAPAPATATSPPPAAGDPRFGTVVVKTKWQRDGSAAAGVTLALYAWSRADHYLFLPEAVTDAQGVARFERIEPGSVLVLGDRSGDVRGGVAAGKTTEFELTLPDGVDLVGEVVDAKGLAVADAAIWLGFDGNQSANGCIVARSDQHGRFVIASVTGGRNVGARRSGYAPSIPQFVTGQAGTTVHVQLRLAERGGLVRGRVVDPDDQPVAGAIVQLGDEHATIDRSGTLPCELLLRTASDANGRFEFDGAMTGELPIVARSRDLAPWIGRVTVNPDVAADVAIRLPLGATLEGKVVDREQQPVGGATLTIHGPCELATMERGSASDGTFRVEHVMPGMLEISAELEESGKARAQLSFVDGETTRWDPLLVSGLALRGQVVDADGRPLPGYQVEASGPEDDASRGWFMRYATCDAAGRFAFEGCPATGLRVEVRPPVGHSWAARLDGVRASDDDLLIKVAADRVCSVWFEGIVVGDDGKPIDNATITAGARDAASIPIETVDAHTGHFKTGPYAPGDFVLTARAAGYAEQFVAAGHVVKDERRNVGTIRLERGAPISVRVHDESGKLPEGVSVLVRVAGTESFPRSVMEDGITRVERAAPGDYEISVWVPGFVPVLRTATVVNGRPLEVDVSLRPGSVVTLRPLLSSRLHDALSNRGGDAIGLLRDCGGVTLAKLWLAKAGSDPWTCEVALLPGRHTIELQIGGAPESNASFDVAADAKADAPIDVTFD